MDTLKAVQFFLDKMFTEVAGMKVLLLDPHTVSLASYLFSASMSSSYVAGQMLTSSVRRVHEQTPIVSLATTQSSLLTHEVYLTDRIEK